MAAPSPKQRAVTMKRNGMDDSLVGAILGISAADVQSLVYETDPDVSLDLGAVQTHTVVLDHEEIIGLRTGHLIMAESPASTARALMHAVLVFKPGGDGENTFGAYNDFDPETALVLDQFTNLGDGVAFGANADDFLGESDPGFIQMHPRQRIVGDTLYVVSPTPLPYPPDIYLYLSPLEDDITEGHPDNTLTVHVAYVEIPL